MDSGEKTGKNGMWNSSIFYYIRGGKIKENLLMMVGLTIGNRKRTTGLRLCRQFSNEITHH